MKNPEAELRDHLKRLVHRYQNIECMVRHISDLAAWKLPGRREALERSASFFNWASYALWNSVLVELSVLLLPRESRSLVNWLHQAKMHSASVKASRHHDGVPGGRQLLSQDEYCRVVESHLAQLDAHKDILERIKAHRDKAIAHLDNAYFQNPEAIYADYPLSNADIKTVRTLVSEILRAHYSYLFRSDMDMTVYTMYTVDEVLRYTLGFIRAQADPALREKGIEMDRYLSCVGEPSLLSDA